jgi:hypothetical protein
MTKYMVSQSEENWKLWGAASGEVCMAGARHDGTGTCICNVKEGGVEKRRWIKGAQYKRTLRDCLRWRSRRVDKGSPPEAKTNAFNESLFTDY